jgi:hypothetical protein
MLHLTFNDVTDHLKRPVQLQQSCGLLLLPAEPHSTDLLADAEVTLLHALLACDLLALYY